MELSFQFFESLILAQDERWRRALSMQVERACAARRKLVTRIRVMSLIGLMTKFAFD